MSRVRCGCSVGIVRLLRRSTFSHACVNESCDDGPASTTACRCELKQRANRSILGTRKVSRVEENVAAADLVLGPQVRKPTDVPPAVDGHHTDAQMERVER
jgi:hypothetical protein